MYFTDRSKHCKENTMQDYGPFDKPYGFFTRSGLLERAKAFLVLIESILMLVIAALITTPIGSAPNVFLEFLFFAISAPVFMAGFLLMLLGIAWAYFPQWKPEWRKRLTW